MNLDCEYVLYLNVTVIDHSLVPVNVFDNFLHASGLSSVHASSIPYPRPLPGALGPDLSTCVTYKRKKKIVRKAFHTYINHIAPYALVLLRICNILNLGASTLVRL